jgi:hypothetical protein
LMFGHPDDAEYERYFALRDLLFAETIFGWAPSFMDTLSPENDACVGESSWLS